MKTNFFEHIAGLAVNGTLQINIKPNESGTLTVSVMVVCNNPKITTGKNIPPMLLTGLAQELDEAFFAQIGEPVKRTVKLFTNADAYQKELDKAGQAGKKDTHAKTDKAKGTGKGDLFTQQPEAQPDDDDLDEVPDEQPDDSEAIAEKQRRYDEAMQRVNTLNGQMKYAEAIAQLPDPEEYPDKVEEIKNKGAALLKRQEMYASLQQDV